MEIVKASKQEIKEMFGKHAVAGAVRGSEKQTLYLPHRASTRTKLHEIYHVKVSPERLGSKGRRKFYHPDEAVLEELRANEFSQERMGKEGLSLGLVKDATMALLDEGYKPAVVMGSTIRGLKTLGYGPLDRSQRGDLWNWMKRFYREGRRK